MSRIEVHWQDPLYLDFAGGRQSELGSGGDGSAEMMICGLVREMEINEENDRKHCNWTRSRTVR